MFFPFQTLLNWGIVAKTLKSKYNMKNSEVGKILGVATLLLPLYHEIFKYMYDTMGKDYKNMHHIFVKTFRNGLVTEIKKQQSEVMKDIRPLL